MSIGPQNRTAAYLPETEAAILSTSPGMASWADPTVPHTCGDCCYWDEIERGRSKGQDSAESTSRLWTRAARRSTDDSKLAGSVNRPPTPWREQREGEALVALAGLELELNSHPTAVAGCRVPARSRVSNFNCKTEVHP
jgi:hypothetical protein